jgi:hypothetical protein
MKTGQATGCFKNRRVVISSILVVLAVSLLWPIYNSPVWWVSLEAPNYPQESFPDGVKILFHCNGVFSGCQVAGNENPMDPEALDCVHEMDTINHYVGMYPIASGGPLELFFSLFLLAFIGVLLLAFISMRPRVRTVIMAVGFATVLSWMGVTYFGQGGLKFHSSRYLSGRLTSLGESSEEEEEKPLTAGEALIARLKASLAESSAPEEDVVAAQSEKQESLKNLQKAFEQDRNRVSTVGQEWQGKGSQLVPWHYEKSLGRYFRDESTLGPMVSGMARAGDAVFWGIAVLMVVIVFAARKPEGLFNWLLALVPAGLPLYFIIEYSTWLWWYGHNMNEMGAFTLKSFMPTVFGQGKVAQFTTNSYPASGFWLMVLFSALLITAVLLRRESLVEDADE